MAAEIASGVQNVTKPLKKIKAGRLLLAAAAMAWPGAAVAVPVSVAWQVPLNESERYILQVTREAGFGTFLLNRQVDGNGFTWDTPGEGVFHWRLTRPGKTGRGVEGSTFVSGSFVAVSGGERKKPARISWQPIAGADRYKLYLVDGEGRTRTMISSTTTFTLPALTNSVMVEVVPYSGSQRTFRDYHFQPSLKFDAGDGLERAPAATGAVVAATAVGGAAAATGGDAGVVKSPGAVGNFRGRPGSKPVASQPAEKAQGAVPPPEPSAAPPPAAGEAVQASVTPQETPAPAEAPPVADGEAGRRRRHLVYGMFFYEQDRLQLTKLDIDLESREGVFGAGAGFWLNPISGLIVSGQGGYHEHKGIVTQEERFPDEKILVEQARYTGTFDLGFNVLAPFDIDDHVLSLSITGGAMQLPALPVQLDTTTGEPPTFEKHAYNLIGGTVGYGWLSDFMAVVLDGTAAQAKEDDAKLTQGRLVFDFYPSEHFAILLGGFFRKAEITRCHADPALCLSEGKVRTETREAGGFVGLGGVFM
jgi:hypothetical protein